MGFLLKIAFSMPEAWHCFSGSGPRWWWWGPGEVSRKALKTPTVLFDNGNGWEFSEETNQEVHEKIGNTRCFPVDDIQYLGLHLK